MHPNRTLLMIKRKRTAMGPGVTVTSCSKNSTAALKDSYSSQESSSSQDQNQQDDASSDVDISGTEDDMDKVRSVNQDTWGRSIWQTTQSVTSISSEMQIERPQTEERKRPQVAEG